jgi:hypothetical protein
MDVVISAAQDATAWDKHCDLVCADETPHCLRHVHQDERAAVVSGEPRRTGSSWPTANYRALAAA